MSWGFRFSHSKVDVSRAVYVLDGKRFETFCHIAEDFSS